MFSGRVGEPSGKDIADGFRRPFPYQDNGGTGSCDQGTGVEASQLEYGGENHDRLGVDDEQGVRDDRGEVAVRGYAGTDTGRGASAVGDPFDGSV